MEVNNELGKLVYNLFKRDLQHSDIIQDLVCPFIYTKYQQDIPVQLQLRKVGLKVRAEKGKCPHRMLKRKGPSVPQMHKLFSFWK